MTLSTPFGVAPVQPSQVSHLHIKVQIGTYVMSEVSFWVFLLLANMICLEKECAANKAKVG